MQKHWSTREVRAPQRQAYWVDAVCDTYVQLDCEVPKGAERLSGVIDADVLATLGFSRVTASAQAVKRTPEKIAHAVDDYFLVSVQSSGHGAITQDGRVAMLAPGDFALYDSTRPYELRFEDAFQQFVVRFPARALREKLKSPERITACTVSGQRGAGRLFSNMVRSVAADLAALEPGSMAAVAEGIESVLVGCLSAVPGAGPLPSSNALVFHRERIKAFAQRRLTDPALDIHQIAAHLNLSPSTVHRAFEGEPVSLSRWIWLQRLEGARRDLADPAQAARSVTEIAFAWGFNDAAHFSRSFRSHYNCAPRDLRVAHGARIKR